MNFVERIWNAIVPFSWYARMEGCVKQCIKESCNVGERRVIEIYVVVFVVIVTIRFVYLIDIYSGGKGIVERLKR